MEAITKEQIINFIFDYKIKENKMKIAMKKQKDYIINCANLFEKEGCKNRDFYKRLLLS